MDRKDLANLMFPNVTETVEDLEKRYPRRNDYKVITRYAPSPTGFIHMGNLLSAFIAYKFAKDNDGIFYLRIEDTDNKRKVENGISNIISDLSNFSIIPDEGVIKEDVQKGKYGPYIQSERKKIYEVYAKYMIENDLAYPCFCTEKELENIRNNQELKKERIGYYSKYATCRNMSVEEACKKIKNNEKYVIRLKSRGNFEKRVVVDDLVRGKVIFPENDIDHILIKSDGIPVYHFAHVIDDHLMSTTHILRGEEWLSSTPLHLQLFSMLNFETPKYAHLGLIMKIDENGVRRKLSKRKDPEAAISFYHEKGVPIEAVKLYLMTIANSNFEAFLDSNPNAKIEDFKFDFKKVGASGTLFDLDKLLNISRNYISRLTAIEVYNYTLNWALEFDKEFALLLEKYKDYSINIFNIERNQKKPRKDYDAFSNIKLQIWYMYDEYFHDLNYNWGKINDLEEIKEILNSYIKDYYDENDDKNMWFDKIKKLSSSFGYCTDMKEYKLNPDNYKGSVADIATVIRVAVTTSQTTPDLYEILKILGKGRMENRILNIVK